MRKKLEGFKPGEKVPTSGIYDVIHDNLDSDHHNLPHQVTAIADKVFLSCHSCHGSVRFRLRQAGEHVEDHDHFESGFGMEE